MRVGIRVGSESQQALLALRGTRAFALAHKLHCMRACHTCHSGKPQPQPDVGATAQPNVAAALFNTQPSGSPA